LASIQRNEHPKASSILQHNNNNFPTTLYWHAKVKIGDTYQESKDRDNLNVVFDLFGGENEHAYSIYPHTPPLLFLNNTQW
jgi:hypothetical protein